MSDVKSADIVLVQFPFTDLTQTKLRPAVVVSREEVHRNEDDYTLLFISSVIPSKVQPYEALFEKDHPDFKESGLKKDSLFKANKLTTVQRRLLKRRLGRLGPQILKSLQEAMQMALFI